MNSGCVSWSFLESFWIQLEFVWGSLGFQLEFVWGSLGFQLGFIWGSSWFHQRVDVGSLESCLGLIRVNWGKVMVFEVCAFLGLIKLALLNKMLNFKIKRLFLS